MIIEGHNEQQSYRSNKGHTGGDFELNGTWSLGIWYWTGITHLHVFSFIGSVQLFYFSCILPQMSVEAKKAGGIVDVALDDILVMDSYCE